MIAVAQGIFSAYAAMIRPLISIVQLMEIAAVTPAVGFNFSALQNMTGRDSNAIARTAIAFFAW